jgi:hypothetical protein
VVTTAVPTMVARTTAAPVCWVAVRAAMAAKTAASQDRIRATAARITVAPACLAVARAATTRAITADRVVETRAAMAGPVC